MTDQHNVYADAREALNRLQSAVTDGGPTNVVLSWHKVDDETATAVIEALDTYAWSTNNSGPVNVWLTGVSPGGMVRVNLHLATPTGTDPDHPNVVRARKLIARVVGH